jgi:predicted transcriptional regulator
MLETIELSSELQARLADSARREAKSTSDLVSEALEYYFEAQQEEKINKEIEAYEAMHTELWHTIPYQWVAIHNQKLIDRDSDRTSLYRRVRAQYGRVVILIRQVRETPTHEIWVRTPSTGRIEL